MSLFCYGSCGERVGLVNIVRRGRWPFRETRKVCSKCTPAMRKQGFRIVGTERDLTYGKLPSNAGIGRALVAAYKRDRERR